MGETPALRRSCAPKASEKNTTDTLDVAPRLRVSACKILLVLLLRFGEGRHLLGRGFRLVALFPLRRRHAVDDFARRILFERDAFLRRRLAIPVAQTVAAEIARD